jgi:hypothetical protein
MTAPDRENRTLRPQTLPQAGPVVTTFRQPPGSARVERIHGQDTSETKSILIRVLIEGTSLNGREDRSKSATNARYLPLARPLSYSIVTQITASKNYVNYG